MADTHEPVSTPRTAGTPSRDPAPTGSEARRQGRDFVRQIIDGHVTEGRYDRVVTRFPPEPNGYLHIGHAKSICLNFGLAAEYDGDCHLRFDDTNPLTEDEEYTRAIQTDVRWLGYEWTGEVRHASDYFERMYEVAERLIRKGLAYVDSASDEEIREKRGTVTEPGVPTADRDRGSDESLDLFRRMRDGEFEDGELVLRARIDLSSPNMIMRDPVLYRIRHAHHYRTGDAWCIYPLYDFAHCLEDAFEGISHSLCTLEFDNNREIYDWVLDHAGFEEPRTHQYEFARLALDYTVLSKRKLIRLVREGHVSGWDDPRMPTIAGLRRRGVPPEAIRAFCEMIGVAKVNSRVDVGKLEYAIRDEMNRTAPRAMAVLDPLEVELVNWSPDRTELLTALAFPDEGTESGTRELPFGRRILIDQEDFSYDPPKGWKRLSPGAEVRLRNAWVVRCDEVVEGEDGRPALLRCTVDFDTRGRNPDRKIAGTIHWISADHGVPAEVRLYDRLFSVADPDDVPEEGDFTDHLNPDSLEVVRTARVEPGLAGAEPGTRVQFERIGYFVVDPESRPDALVLNRTVTLRDTWTKKGDEVDAEAARRAKEAAREADRPKGPVAADDRVSDQRRAAREADPALEARFERYRNDLGLSLDDADNLTGDRATGDFFEAALAVAGKADMVAHWMVNDLRGERGDRPLSELPIDGAAFGTLLKRVDDDVLARRAAKEVLAEMVEHGTPVDEIIERDGLTKVSDDHAIRALVEEVLAEWPKKLAEYRDGNRNLIGLFMGQVMQKSGGNADPGVVRRILTETLDA